MNGAEQIKPLIEKAYATPDLLERPEYKEAVLQAIELLDRGQIRIAEPDKDDPDAEWVVHPWVNQAILLYFRITSIRPFVAGDLEFFDKIPTKKSWEGSGVRVVPAAIARKGSYIESGAVLMPSYVNIGARVGSGSMVDTWATVGSCAQVGRGVHLSGGVGLGGVLEPPGARPVIIEDGAFIGSRCIIVEGVRVGREAVIAANVSLTASTPIIDVSGPEPKTYKGYVPPRSVVLPGTRPKEFPAGTYQIACALIIGRRKESTDKRTSLNEVLRKYNVPT